MPKHYIYRGKQYTLTELTRLTGVKSSTLLDRVGRMGMSVEDAINIPSKRTKNKNKKNGKGCHATFWRECFVCKKKDCVRDPNRSLIGEPNVHRW